MEAFFEILIPSSRVVRANDTRDIQIHKGPLQLKDYKGNLKNWDGQLLATRFFMVSSEGNAKEYQCCYMGRYILVRDIVMRKGDESRYVYKKDDGKRSRFMYSYDGYWIVGEVAGDDSGYRLFLITIDDLTLYSPKTNHGTILIVMIGKMMIKR